MRILLAVDGSVYSFKAVNHVLSHLDWYRSEPELHLLHVQLPIPPGRARAFLGTEALNQYYREESEAALAIAEKPLKERNVAYHATWKVGEVAEEVRRYAEAHQVDLIVMGSHGHGALQGLVMGSVATKVLAATTTPVLIVR